jgi:GNAT superfamily N-acetyltransferase
MDIRITDCGYRHLRRLAAVFGASFPDLGDDEIRFTLATNELRVALDGDRIVGFTSAHPLGNDPAGRWLNFIAVAPEARGRGLGTLLLADLEREAMLRGVERIELAVAPQNASAIRLYESNGYVPIERPGKSLSYVKDVLPLGAPRSATGPGGRPLRRLAARLVLWGSPVRAAAPTT